MDSDRRVEVRLRGLQLDPHGEALHDLCGVRPHYVEPEHAHDSCHSICVLEGVQIVGGEHMRPGDYVWADRNVVHGPYEYPDGCIVFVSFWGDPAHRFPGSVAGDISEDEERAQ